MRMVSPMNMIVNWLDVDQWLWTVESEGSLLLILMQKATSMAMESKTLVSELWQWWRCWMWARLARGRKTKGK